MVLQRYALRFTISDAILDSLKLPRNPSKPKQDSNQLDEEHKPSSTTNNSKTSDPLHKPEPTVTPLQRHKEMDTDTLGQQETQVSVCTTSPTPNLLSTVTNSDNKPPQSLELNEPVSNQTVSSTTHQTQPITQPQTKHTPPQTAQVQPQTTQPIQILSSPPSVAPRPVPLLAAKPYCQPRNTQPGHKPVKVRARYQLYQIASLDTYLTLVPVIMLELQELFVACRLSQCHI